MLITQQIVADTIFARSTRSGDFFNWSCKSHFYLIKGRVFWCVAGATIAICECLIATVKK
jgi:hypothetical protein